MAGGGSVFSRSLLYVHNWEMKWGISTGWEDAVGTRIRQLCSLPAALLNGAADCWSLCLRACAHSATDKERLEREREGAGIGGEESRLGELGMAR